VLISEILSFSTATPVNANYRRSSVPQGCKFHSLSFFAAPIGEDDAQHD